MTVINSAPEDQARSQLESLQLASILAIAADAIISIDESQTIELFNAGAERIFGYAAAEAMGRPLDMLLPERFRASHADHLRRFSASGVPSRQMGERQEILGRRKSGEEFPAEASISRLTVGTKPTYTVILRDVSQRKVFEASLKRSEERIRLAVEQGRIGLFEHDHDYGTSYWSPIYRELFGIRDDEIASPSAYLSHVHPDDRSKVEAAIAGALIADRDGAFDVDHRIIWPDGSTRWISANARTHFANGGQPQRTIGAVRDITDTKTLEAGLERRVAERTAELLAVLDAVPDAIVTTDDKLQFRMSNAALPKLFGFDRANIVSLKLGSLFATAEDGSAVVNAWTTSSDDKSAKAVVMVNCRRTDGSTFPAMVQGRPVRTKDGRIVSYVGLIRDLSDELTRREKAIRSQRLEALGQLTGGIAHDSNNLLTVIAGNLELIEDDLGDHPALKYVREAQEASKIGARLNQRLLMFARRRKLEAQTVNLNDQVLAMSELLRRTIGEAIKLTTVLAHDLGATRVDPGEVENAVLNLALNARDAMPDGGNLRIETMNARIGEDEVAVDKTLTPGPYVRLSVSDTGTGMSPDIAARVFEPFFTTKEPGKGTGLGLATIFGFVKQSNGHITVYSEVGLGTTFNLYLPRLADASAQGADSIMAKALSTARNETILVVEDNPQVRALTVERLKRLGYRVHAAASGPEALTVLSAGLNADLVFSDVVMPGGMSGFDLARELGASRPSQRVLLTSGFAEEMARGNESVLADQRILRKPYDIGELARAIREILDRP